MRVLILGGGGTLGAFSAGALHALERKGFVPDAMIGSSAGGINMLRWMNGGAKEAVNFWKRTASPKMVLRGVLHGGNLTSGILDADWFRGRVEAGVDFQRLLEDKRNLAFLVVDLVSGRVAVRGNRTEKSAEALRAVSQAAYALPPLLPPVPLGDAMLADGGFLHNAPLNAAVKLGATEIVYLCNVHALPRAGFGRKRRPSTLTSSLRYMEIFFRRASNVGFADAEIVDGRFRGVPFLAVTPPADLSAGSLIRWAMPSVDAVQHLVDTGFRCATEAFQRWNPDREPVSSKFRALA
jgi:predicted acylesterase/phospholipase RssA